MRAFLRALVRWWRAPVGRTLQERYPAAPGAFTTHYSSVELTDDAFVANPRPTGWRAAKVTWDAHE